MAVEYRKERGKWGYRFYLHGECFKRYAWDTKTEARQAEREARVELEKHPPLPPTALASIIAAYLLDSAENGRSMWRLDGLRYSYQKHILPHFGEAKPVADITADDVNKLIRGLKQKGLKGKTIWHVIVNLKSALNWATKKPHHFLRENPVSGADLSLIGSTKSVKPSLDPRRVDRAAGFIENKHDRAWFDVTRFTGMRKDECNRLQWTDINWRLAEIHIPGTKTEESDNWLPLGDVVLNTLRELYESKDRDPACPWVFPGRSYQTKGRKIYSRRRMFEHIKKRSALKRYMQKNPGVSAKDALKAVGNEKYQGGIHLKPKDLRDYFGTEIAAKTDDPTVVMKLLRHTSLTTTTKYMRAVKNRMREAVNSLGAVSGGDSDRLQQHKTVQNDISRKMAELSKLLINQRNFENFSGGGGRSRTYDAADMSRVRVPPSNWKQ
jgi:integrase